MSEDKHSPSISDEKTGKDLHREDVTSDAEDGSPSATEEEIEFLRSEKKLTRKLDVFIAPVMFLLMLISYLDRGYFLSTSPLSPWLRLIGM